MSVTDSRTIPDTPMEQKHCKPSLVDEYDVTHEEARTTSLAKGTQQGVDLDEKPVVPISLMENGKRIVYLSATTPEKRSMQISFEESIVLGEGSFGRVIKAFLRDGGKRTEIAIKTVVQDKRFKVNGFIFNHEVSLFLSYCL
jgi:hypothetical protein